MHSCVDAEGSSSSCKREWCGSEVWVSVWCGWGVSTWQCVCRGSGDLLALRDSIALGSSIVGGWSCQMRMAGEMGVLGIAVTLVVAGSISLWIAGSDIWSIIVCAWRCMVGWENCTGRTAVKLCHLSWWSLGWMLMSTILSSAELWFWELAGLVSGSELADGIWWCSLRPLVLGNVSTCALIPNWFAGLSINCWLLNCGIFADGSWTCSPRPLIGNVSVCSWIPGSVEFSVGCWVLGCNNKLADGTCCCSPRPTLFGNVSACAIIPNCCAGLLMSCWLLKCGKFADESWLCSQGPLVLGNISACALVPVWSAELSRDGWVEISIAGKLVWTAGMVPRKEEACWVTSRGSPVAIASSCGATVRVGDSWEVSRAAWLGPAIKFRLGNDCKFGDLKNLFDSAFKALHGDDV